MSDGPGNENSKRNEMSHCSEKKSNEDGNLQN
jgi:hypothetical protein